MVHSFFKILAENFEKFIFTKHLIDMLDICLQIISPCVMQHVWIGTWLSEFIWMFLLCIVLSVRMSSSWRHDILVLGHGTGQENVMWRSLKLWLMKLALSPFFTGNQPEAFLPQQSRPGQASDQGLPAPYSPTSSSHFLPAFCDMAFRLFFLTSTLILLPCFICGEMLELIIRFEMMPNCTPFWRPDHIHHIVDFNI